MVVVRLLLLLLTYDDVVVDNVVGVDDDVGIGFVVFDVVNVVVARGDPVFADAAAGFLRGG